MLRQIFEFEDFASAFTPEEIQQEKTSAPEWQLTQPRNSPLALTYPNFCEADEHNMAHRYICCCHTDFQSQLEELRMVLHDLEFHNRCDF